MQGLPTEWSALAMLVFLLGVKHGFDADHLATIDGLTRINALAGRSWARCCGALFSFGHGLIVIAIAIGVGLATQRWEAPPWLAVSGTWISVFFLIALGVLNLRAVLATPQHEIVAPVGLKGRWIGRLDRAEHPAWVAGIGALFALSFDTVSQAALFAVAAAQFGGAQYALALGLLFMLGMLVTDGINGIWIARLIARSDQLALIASRVMSLAVAGVSLLVAAFSLAKLALPALDAWSQGREAVFGAIIVTILAGSYLLARALTPVRALSRNAV